MNSMALDVACCVVKEESVLLFIFRVEITCVLHKGVMCI